MSKKCVITQIHNEEKQQHEYFVKGYDITESIKFLLKKHKEAYDKERRIFAEAKGYIEAQKEYETQLHNQQNEIQQIKQKLAEKDKEIKKLTLLYFGDENTETILTTNKMIQHIKISFAVEQLEKVKEDVKNVHIEDTQYDCYCFQETTRDKCVEIIDNQINELKEMKQNE